MGFVLLLALGLVVVLDQFTKALVAGRLEAGSSVRLGGSLRIRPALNPLRGAKTNSFVLIFLWVLALGTIILVTQDGHFFQRWPSQAGLGAALGGAAGNLIDRCRRGGVLDFVDLGWWPVFNLADAAITLGALAGLLFIR